MDDVDRKILLKLASDARTPFKSIGKEIGVSTDTVSKRYRKLKQSGIIQKATLILDLKRANRGMMAVLGIKSEAGHIWEVAREIEKLEEVFQFGKAFGAHDFIIFLISRDLEQLEAAIDKVSRIPNIKNLDVSIITGQLVNYPERQVPMS